MRPLPHLTMAALTLLVAGCASVKLDYLGETLPPSGGVQLFLKAEDITRPYRELGESVATAPAEARFISVNKMQAALLKKAQQSGADAMLVKDVKKDYAGSTSFTGYGRSQSQKHYNLTLHATFLKYTDSAPLAVPAPKPMPALVPEPAPKPKPVAKPKPVPQPEPAAQPKPVPPPEEEMPDPNAPVGF